MTVMKNKTHGYGGKLNDAAMMTVALFAAKGSAVWSDRGHHCIYSDTAEKLKSRDPDE